MADRERLSHAVRRLLAAARKDRVAWNADRVGARLARLARGADDGGSRKPAMLRLYLREAAHRAKARGEPRPLLVAVEYEIDDGVPSSPGCVRGDALVIDGGDLVVLEAKSRTAGHAARFRRAASQARLLAARLRSWLEHLGRVDPAARDALAGRWARVRAAVLTDRDPTHLVFVDGGGCGDGGAAAADRGVGCERAGKAGCGAMEPGQAHEGCPVDGMAGGA